MKKLTAFAVIFALVGCASGPSAYGPVDSKSKLGFQNIQLEPDRFRVRFTGRDATEAEDYALLRAAEIAINEGYSHFEILDGYIVDNQGRRFPFSSAIGIGIGSGGYHRGGTHSHVHADIGIDDVVRALEGDMITSSIEIRLHNSPAQASNIYEAKSIAGSIKPTVFK